jgi:hypothetical protein
VSAKLLSDPLAALGGTRRAYVVEPWKVLYISTAKNACTSIKWLIAELAGEDLRRFKPGLAPLLNTDEAIHLRRLFQRTPKLNEIPTEVRRTISPDNGWFVFSVVRDPRARLFSAWQNKYLMHNPAYRRWRKEPWYPRVPDSVEDVLASFATFVELIHNEPDHPVTDDAHFTTQMRLLQTDAVSYSKIYDIAELSTFVAEIGNHLRTQGWLGEPSLRQTNDTPLPANRHLFDEPVRSRIERFYAEDFENFGHLWDYAKIEKGKDWPATAIGDLRTRIALGERIGDLLAEARRSARQAETAQQRLAELAEAQRADASKRDARGLARRTAWLWHRVMARLGRS